MEHREHPIWHRFQRRKRQHKHASLPLRVLLVFLGTILILGGVLIAPLPGPGPVVLLPIGLALLALEFSWAERAFEYNLKLALKAQKKALQATPRQKVLSAMTSLCALAAIIAAILLWDIPLLPF